MAKGCEDESKAVTQGYLSLHCVSWHIWQRPRLPDPTVLAPPHSGPGLLLPGALGVREPLLHGTCYSLRIFHHPGRRWIIMCLQTNPRATRIPPNGKHTQWTPLAIHFLRAEFQSMVFTPNQGRIWSEPCHPRRGDGRDSPGVRQERTEFQASLPGHG